MYKTRYDEIAADSPREARDQERQMIERSIALLEAAHAAGSSSREATEAIYFANTLWSYFLDDLASPNNALPNDAKAGLISVGIYVLQECDAIRAGRSQNFEGLAAISRTVAEGLQ